MKPVPVALNGNIPLHFYLTSFARLFSDERPDVIYVQHDPHGLATMQAFRANRRSVRVPIGFKNDQNILKRYPWPIPRGERSVYRDAAFALVVAPPMAEVLRSKGYRGPIDVIPHSLDLSLYRPMPRPGPREDLVVGYMGRLVPEKGVDTLIQALARTPERIRALIVGSGPSEGDLRSLAADAGVADRVEWRGYVDHPSAPQAYAEMDVLAVPSKTTAGWREQFGRVVIEALACGVPVCSSDSGEPPALIAQTDGGWTFAEGDAAELAERFRWLDANRDQLRVRAESGLDGVRRLFSADAVAESFAGTIRRYGLGER